MKTFIVLLFGILFFTSCNTAQNEIKKEYYGAVVVQKQQINLIGTHAFYVRKDSSIIRIYLNLDLSRVYEVGDTLK